MSDQTPPPGSVAVIVTTYNHAAFLESALHSVTQQSRPAAEIIVVDDGSTDHPERVTNRFHEVCLIRQPNAGLAAARNTGWRAATSELVVFLDADDRLLPDALRVNAERLAATPAAGFSYGAYLDVDMASGRKSSANFLPAGDGFVAFLRKNPIRMHATVMYRRARLAEIGGFDSGFPACEDYDVYLRMASRFPILSAPVPLAEYWHHGSNMSRDSAMMLRVALLVLRHQRPSVTRPAEVQAYREGVAAWKRHYVRAWCLQLARGVRSGSVERSLLGQGISLVRQAPVTVAGAPVRGVGQLARYLRGRAGRQRAAGT